MTTTWFAPRTWMLAAAIAAPALGQAQAPAQAANKCDIDESKPTQISLAAFAIQQAAGAKDAAARQTSLKNLFKPLYDNPDKINNPVGRSWLLGQGAILWMQDASAPTNPKKSDLNMPGDGTIDLLKFADSLFTVVETAKPDCGTQVLAWRSQSAWFRNVQAAFAALGNNDLAKAEEAARRSLVINRTSAYGPYVLANVAQRKANGPDGGTWSDSAARYLDLAVKAAGTDTIYTEIRRRSLLDLGRVHNDMFDAAVAKSDTKTACASHGQAAIASFAQYVTEAPLANDGLAARASLSGLYATCGDTAKAEAVYDDVAKNPTKYNDIEATQAGVTMTRLNRPAKATPLFEAALAINPLQRDALNNLAASYFAQNKFKEMFPVVEKLVVVDPNNPDNWLWYAYAYQGLAKPLGVKDPKRKVFADSMVYFNNISETMPVKVTFNAFSRGEAESKVGGSVEFRNLNMPAPAAKPAAKGAKGAKAAPAAPVVADKTVTLRFTFFDKAGTPIDSSSVTVGPIKSGESKEFATSVKKAGVMSFKYAKID